MIKLLMTVVALQGDVLFESDFESSGDLGGWSFTRPEAAYIVDTGDDRQGSALLLRADGPWNHALLLGSEDWGPVRMEGLVLFPEDVHNYLGFIWGYSPNVDSDRTDFATAYVKGNGSYIRVNHRYDGNPTRAMNEERRIALEGEDAVVIGRWQPFAIEVVGSVAHLYFGNAAVPKLTEDLYPGPAGALGFKPRVIGGDVLVDDIRVTSVDRFTYNGPERPGVEYDTTGMLTDWSVLGPTRALHPELARSAEPMSMTVREGGRALNWRRFPVDRRGAVVTSRVVQFRGPATRAYFATRVRVDEDGPNQLMLTSIDDLSIWVDGRFEGYYNRDRMAWHDFLSNSEHRGRLVGYPLEPGEHWLLVEVRGALYAGGGFWAGLIPSG